jgi:hypothetical protein
MLPRGPRIIHPVPKAATPPISEGSKIESLVRRVVALAALGWLGFIGYLLRDCPRSGAICQTSNSAVAAAVVALGIVLLGHVVVRALGRLRHDHHAVP